MKYKQLFPYFTEFGLRYLLEEIDYSLEYEKDYLIKTRIFFDKKAERRLVHDILMELEFENRKA